MESKLSEEPSKTEEDTELKVTSKEENLTKKVEDDFKIRATYNSVKEHILCMIGSDMQRHYGEKDVFNLIHKYLKPHLNPRTLPIDSIYKKKGKSFAFLNF